MCHLPFVTEHLIYVFLVICGNGVYGHSHQPESHKIFYQTRSATIDDDAGDIVYASKRTSGQSSSIGHNTNQFSVRNLKVKKNAGIVAQYAKNWHSDILGYSRLFSDLNHNHHSNAVVRDNEGSNFNIYQYQKQRKQNKKQRYHFSPYTDRYYLHDNIEYHKQYKPRQRLKLRRNLEETDSKEDFNSKIQNNDLEGPVSDQEHVDQSQFSINDFPISQNNDVNVGDNIPSPDETSFDIPNPVDIPSRPNDLAIRTESSDDLNIPNDNLEYVNIPDDNLNTVDENSNDLNIGNDNLEDVYIPDDSSNFANENLDDVGIPNDNLEDVYIPDDSSNFANENLDDVGIPNDNLEDVYIPDDSSNFANENWDDVGIPNDNLDDVNFTDNLNISNENSDDLINANDYFEGVNIPDDNLKISNENLDDIDIRNDNLEDVNIPDDNLNILNENLADVDIPKDNLEDVNFIDDLKISNEKLNDILNDNLEDFNLPDDKSEDLNVHADATNVGSTIRNAVQQNIQKTNHKAITVTNIVNSGYFNIDNAVHITKGHDIVNHILLDEPEYEEMQQADAVDKYGSQHESSNINGGKEKSIRRVGNGDIFSIYNEGPSLFVPHPYLAGTGQKWTPPFRRSLYPMDSSKTTNSNYRRKKRSTLSLRPIQSDQNQNYSTLSVT